MKRIILLTVVFAVCFGSGRATIRNGYDVHIDSVIRKLYRLQMLNDAEATPSLKADIERCVNYIAAHKLTSALIRQLMIISPDVYTEINDIKDKKGRNVDVYVKLVTENPLRSLEAVSLFRPLHSDEHACRSEYGDHTIVVQLRASCRALRMLYHELGHIRYIVPNLAAYTVFYRKRYAHDCPSTVGHAAQDESGRRAKEYERRFCKDYRSYIRSGGESFRSALVLFQAYRKETGQFHPYTDMVAYRLK